MSELGIPENERPDCELTGTDGNVFFLLGKCNKTLKRAGLTDKAKELTEATFKCASYDEALNLMGKYVNIL